jgi:chitinase
MSQAVQHSLEGAHGQLRDAYRRAGRSLDSTQAWGKLGATPMIGVNDTLTDLFSRADAQRLARYSRDKGLGRLSMWSANRDDPCPQGPQTDAVSNTCSGLAQAPLDYSRILDRVSGRLLAPADDRDDPADEVVDDPATSPYPVWDVRDVYERGERVVRHHRVYVAKWWTQGDDPVTPVANVHDSPWRLVGPVLASDRPPSTTTLPAGTYPEWDPAVAYRQGDKVLRKGVGYEADWFAQGIDPAAPPTGDGPSPWRPLAAS